MAVIKKRLSAAATHVEHVVRKLARVAEREELAVDLLKLVLVQLARGAVLEETLVLDVSCRASMEAYPLLEFLDVSLALSVLKLNASGHGYSAWIHRVGEASSED